MLCVRVRVPPSSFLLQSLAATRPLFAENKSAPRGLAPIRDGTAPNAPLLFIGILPDAHAAGFAPQNAPRRFSATFFAPLPPHRRLLPGPLPPSPPPRRDYPRNGLHRSHSPFWLCWLQKRSHLIQFAPHKELATVVSCARPEHAHFAQPALRPKLPARARSRPHPAPLPVYMTTSSKQASPRKGSTKSGRPHQTCRCAPPPDSSIVATRARLATADPPCHAGKPRTRYARSLPLPHPSQPS